MPRRQGGQARWLCGLVGIAVSNGAHATIESGPRPHRVHPWRRRHGRPLDSQPRAARSPTPSGEIPGLQSWALRRVDNSTGPACRGGRIASPAGTGRAPLACDGSSGCRGRVGDMADRDRSACKSFVDSLFRQPLAFRPIPTSYSHWLAWGFCVRTFAPFGCAGRRGAAR